MFFLRGAESVIEVGVADQGLPEEEALNLTGKPPLRR
jgi:hypothetical protein